MRTPLLIAGIGNIFLGDDGFGVAVVHRLQKRSLPAGVCSLDFGIRGFDLACALESCDAAILIDATQRGGSPGTLYVLEPQLDEPLAPPLAAEGHLMTPDHVLRGLQKDARPRLIRVVGCEPLSCDPELAAEDEEGSSLFTLSPPVRQAVDEAVNLVERLAAQILEEVAAGDREGLHA
jgi:hydrogenase maturation protease